jgi:hypothetical protein
MSDRGVDIYRRGCPGDMDIDWDMDMEMDMDN